MQTQHFSRFPTEGEEPNRLVNAAMELLNGALNGDPQATQTLIASVDQSPIRSVNVDREKSSSFSKLRSRERETLALLNEGKDTNKICSVMVVSPSTVRTYKARICRAYGVRTTKEALKEARAKGDVCSERREQVKK